MSTELQLPGLNLLLTRPQGQAEGIKQKLESLGAEVKSLPALEIAPTEESSELRNIFLNIDQFHQIIFISPNAAHYGGKWIDNFWPQLPVEISWLAVGHKTKTALSGWDIHATAPSLSEDSEGLLALPALTDCTGQKILIIRGVGGRETLADTLTQRGASVTCAEVYRRLRPEYSNNQVEEALKSATQQAIIVYSGETLQNLVQICDKAGVFIRKRVILVPGNRVASLAKSLAFENILIPDSLEEEDIIKCLINWWQGIRHNTLRTSTSD